VSLAGCGSSPSRRLPLSRSLEAALRIAPTGTELAQRDELLRSQSSRCHGALRYCEHQRVVNKRIPPVVVQKKCHPSNCSEKVSPPSCMAKSKDGHETLGGQPIMTATS
jgi:hypothetical protein